MDWVHCNSCYVQPGDVEGKKFSITNCGHIYCAECLQLPELKECRVCHIKYSTMSLSPKMSPEVETYFLNPIQYVQKAIKVLEFQQNHRGYLVTYYRDRLKQYKTLKKEVYTLKEELNRVKEENKKYQEEIKRRREEVYHYKKKFELFAKQQAAKRAPQPSPNASQFIPKEPTRTPNSGIRTPSGNSMYSQNSSFDGSQSTILKRPSGASDFFLLSGSAKSSTDGTLFNTPNPPRFPGSYRTTKTFTPTGFNSPATPESSQSQYSQKDPLQRKMKLPGDRGGPSPASKIGLHRLNLSRPTSTPSKETPITSKYLKYF